MSKLVITWWHNENVCGMNHVTKSGNRDNSLEIIFQVSYQFNGFIRLYFDFVYIINKVEI